MARHAVALVPGFLGFNHRQGTTYFADRFVAGLRSRLEDRCGAPIPVVPVSTLPISSLADRQSKLLTDLAELDHKLGYPMWHLLGHSTGGVDAAMLARTHRLKHTPRGSVFSEEKMESPRLASVTTLSAPHYGTGLALSPFARLFSGGPSWAGVAELATAATDAFRRDKIGARLEFVAPSLVSGHTSRFYRSFLNEPLIKDLDPGVVGMLTRADNRREGIAITSFATLAPPPSSYPVDPLFAHLWSFTQEKVRDAEPAPEFPALSDALVVSSSPDMPVVDGRSNDGIVNTERQIDGNFGGLIVGDHGDVIGRYQRHDVLDGRIIDPGLLTSGAHFGDDEFFRVLDRIARAIPCALRLVPDTSIKAAE